MSRILHAGFKRAFVSLTITLSLALVCTPVLAGGGIAALTIDQVDAELFPQVTAYLSARDQLGLPVSGLTDSNMQVVENGNPVSSVQSTSVKNQRLAVTIALAIDRGQSQGDSLKSDQVAANLLVATLSPSDRTLLYAFGEETSLLKDFAGNAPELVDAIQSVTASGQTRFYDAALVTIQKLQTLPASSKIGVFLTSGRDQGSKASESDVIQAAQLASVPIYVVAPSDVDNNVLRITQLTGGKVFQAQTGEQLREDFKTLLDSFRNQYAVSYVSNQPADDATHELLIRVQYQGGIAETRSVFVAKSHTLKVTTPCLLPGSTIGGIVELCAESDTPGRMARVEYSLDGKGISVVTTHPFTFAWDSTQVPFGQHVVHVKVQDHVGNTGEIDVPINVVAPVSVQIVQPGDKSAVAVAFTPTLKISSLLPVKRVDYFVDDVLVATASTQPFAPKIDISKTVPGPHTFIARAFDQMDRQGESRIQIQVLTQSTGGYGALVGVVLVVILFLMIVIAFSLRRRRSRAR